MTDIAPLGFAIDTSGLDKGKMAAADFAKSVSNVTIVSEKATQAMVNAAKAELDAAKATQTHANAKLNLVKITEGANAAAIKEATTIKATADAAVVAAKAKYDLAKAGEAVTVNAEQLGNKNMVLQGVLRGVSTEAVRLASQMGLGAGVGGQIGLGGAMGAAQAAAQRLQPSMLSLGGVAGKLGIGIGGLVVGFGTLTTAVADNQDRWASYQQQLVNSLGSQSEAQSSMQEIVALANEVGIGVDTALTSFNRFARVKDAIGATNEELVQMTEIILKIGRSSGTDMQSMSTAMMQFSQAIGSGRLNGDELRSIMENMTPLAKAIADGLGVSVGQLRRMGAEGELTGEKVFRALLGQGEKAEKMFAEMPKTVEQAKTRMANQWDELQAHIGKMIDATGILQSGYAALSWPIEQLNKMFKKLSGDGVATFESNLDKMEKRLDNVVQRMNTAATEFDKQFNKDISKRAELEKEREEAARRLADAQRELPNAQSAYEARLRSVRAAREEIQKLIALENRGLAFRDPARERRLTGLGTASAEPLDAAAKRLEALQKIIANTSPGIAEIDRQIAALGYNDAFEKLAQDAGDLEEALSRGGAQFADMWLQAIKISRDTKNSIEDVIAALQRMQRAQDAMADAKAIKEINKELAKTVAMTAAIGSGDYASRLASQTADIAALRADRATQSMGGFTISAPQGRGGANLPNDIVQFFQASGMSLEQARGIAAGIMSESSGNERAVNPDSGAYGLGQWLGSRKEGLFKRYGNNPNRQQQLQYLLYELQGGDWGGGSVRQGGSAADTAARYIRDFMRPGPDTAGGIQRALGYLGGGSVQLAGTTMGGGGNLEGVIGAKGKLFDAQEAQRAKEIIEKLTAQAIDTAEITAATRSGPEAVKALELELKVREATLDVAPAYREQVENAIREAEAKKEALAAEQKITSLRMASNDNERRNAAARTGSPAAMRQLELELRIEEIRRTTPLQKQGRLIAETIRADQIERQGELAKRQGAMEEERRNIEDQYSLIGLTVDEERVQNRLLRERNFLRTMGVEIGTEEYAQFMAQAEALERQNIELEKSRRRWDFFRDTGRETAEDIGQAFSSAFGRMIRSGKVGWKSFMDDITEAFSRAIDKMVEELVISPLVTGLTNLLTRGLSSLFGGAASGAASGGSSFGSNFTVAAQGAAFNQPVHPYGFGDILMAPTRFRTGRTSGLGGEGGPEGIMPLKRGPDGRLGVAAHGGGGGDGTVVNIYDQRAAGGSEAVEVNQRETEDGRRQIDVMVRDSVKGHFRRGSFDAEQRGLFGNSRQVVRR